VSTEKASPRFRGVEDQYTGVHRNGYLLGELVERVEARVVEGRGRGPDKHRHAQQARAVHSMVERLGT
jgi:hypothetical protein